MIEPKEYAKIQGVIASAIRQGLDHAAVEFKLASLELIYDLCVKNQEISGNEITKSIKAMPVKTHHYCVVGGLIKTAEGFGWIRATGRREGSKSAHLVPIQIWQSLIYGQAAPSSVAGQGKLI
jgi:hypothetical protein